MICIQVTRVIEKIVEVASSEDPRAGDGILQSANKFIDAEYVYIGIYDHYE